MGSEYVVDSKGHCFLCLGQISGRVPESGTSSVHSSFRSLSRYLEMDLKKLFLEKGIFPPKSWRDAISEERLGVALCGGCASLNGRFSGLCRQLEEIQREVNSCLSAIHRKLLEEEGEGVKDRTGGEFRRKLEESKKPSSNRGSGRRVIGKLEIVEVMRTEAIQKCVQKLSSAVSARVAVPRLTQGKAVKEKVKVFKAKGNRDNVSDHDTSGEEGQSDPDVDLDPTATIKLEEPEPEEESLEGDDYADLKTEGHRGSHEDSDNESEGGDEDDDDPEYASEDVKRTKVVDSKYSLIILTPSQPPDPDKPLSTINPATMKVKCALCPSAEFKNDRYFQAHYQGIHLKVRYKCTICSKEFTQRPSYDRHHRSAHMKLRYNCDLCPQTFTLKSHLKVHRKGIHLGHRFRCKFCSQEFTQKASRTRHIKRTCEGRRGNKNNRRGQQDSGDSDSHEDT